MKRTPHPALTPESGRSLVLRLRRRDSSRWPSGSQYHCARHLEPAERLLAQAVAQSTAKSVLLAPLMSWALWAWRVLTAAALDDVVAAALNC